MSEGTMSHSENPVRTCIYLLREENRHYGDQVSVKVSVQHGNNIYK